MKRLSLSRRTLLRGSGLVLALPALEAMLPRVASAAPTPPLRFISIFFANGTLLRGAPGTVYNKWECTGAGANFQLSEAMAPLAPHKNDITVIHGLRNESLDYAARTTGGDIDHQHGPTAFLTGQPWDRNRTLGQWTLVRAGRSIDQEMGASTNYGLRVFVLGAQPTGAGGLPTRNHISWESQTQIAPRLDTSQKAYNRLFGSMTPPPPGMPQFDARRSILDFVKGDANALQAKLGTADRAKLDEYFTAVREIERRIAAENTAIMCVVPAAGGYSENDVNNATLLDARAKNMIDLMVLAIQCDQTRVCTFMLDNEENTTLLRDHGGIIRPSDTGHHFQSHYSRAEPGYDPAGTDQNQKPLNQLQYNLWQTAKLAYLLQRLKDVKEADGSPLLDHSMLLYGTSLGDSDSHSHQNVPVILAGKANGALQQGRLIRYTDGRPRENLLLTLLQKFGVQANAVGLSTGILTEV